MQTSSHHWQAWLKPALSRLNTADWLTLLLLVIFGWLASQVVSVINPESTVVAKFFQLFLSGAVVVGYCYRLSPKQDQASLVAPSTAWLTITRAIGLTVLLIGLPLVVLMSAQSASNGVAWLRVLSTLLMVVSLTAIGTLGSQLLKRWGIPLLLVALWWLLFASNHIVENLVQAMLLNNLGTQLIVLMVAVGLVGVTASLVELTKPWQRQPEQFNFTKTWSFVRPMPSFTGMGSLLTVSLLRVIRDKVFLIYLGSFTALLLSRILMSDWPVNWLVIIGLGLAGLSVLVVSRLVKFSNSFSLQYAHLPIGPGQIEFVGFFAGLTLLAAISWIILWGLFGVTAEIMVRLLLAILSSYGAGFLIGLSTRKVEHSGFFDSTWHLVGQMLLFTLVFICSLQLPLSGASLSLLAIMLLVVTTTCYQVTRTWATINRHATKPSVV